MKRLAVLFLLCAVTAASGRADDSLVSASREAKTKRKKSTTKVITNADVKKSKGVLIDSQATLAPVPPSGPGLLEQHEAAKQARALTDAKLASLAKVIGILEKELAAIEASYYDESDLQRRDTELVGRFTETKRKLDDANAEADALKAASTVPNPAPAAPPPDPEPKPL